jgi:hypothetical protein
MSLIRFTTTHDLFEAFPAARDDIRAKPSDDPPLVFMRKLIESETPEDAVAVCAYMLPRREAVWWACQCVRALGGARSSEEEQALKAAEDWVRDPGEERRREALRIGSEGSRNSPTSWLALAAAWSGGNMMPPGQPAVSAPAHMTAKASRAAVLTALAAIPVKQRRGRLVACLQAVRVDDDRAASRS